MLCTLILSFLFLITGSYEEIISITITKDNLNIDYPIFDGIGAISGGGATSKLLVSYPHAIKKEIYDYLFKPQFGASLHMLKVEIGGDTQSTEGTEASHMHTKDDLNCYRGYEWEIIHEAKKRNPDILLYGLPWGFPGWVGNFTDTAYMNEALLAEYIIEWLKCARDEHNVNIDYIGIWNEKTAPLSYIETLQNHLNKSDFKKTLIIANDNTWEIAKEIKGNNIKNIIYAIGAHYPGTYASSYAEALKMPLWSSEDFSTDNLKSGAGCLARIINQNFVNGNMTSTIIWNLINSYYNDLPFPNCGLMNANQPWSGYYEVTNPIWVTAHTTQFAWPGWKYLPLATSGSGKLNNGGTFVSLISPDFDNFTMVIETMTWSFSQCIRPELTKYSLNESSVVVIIPEILASKHQKYYVWRSILDSAKDTNIFYLEQTINLKENREIVIIMPPNNIVTITTVSTGKKGKYEQNRYSRRFPRKFMDNYDKYNLYTEPNYLSPQHGSFEVVLDSQNQSNKVLLQTVLDYPVTWCIEQQIIKSPVAVIGNFNEKQVQLSIWSLVPSNGTPSKGPMICSGVTIGGCSMNSALGLYYWLDITKNEILVSYDILKESIVLIVKTKKLQYDKWYQLAMTVNKTTATIYLDNVIMGHVNATDVTRGFEGIGALTYGHILYDKFDLEYYN